MKKIIILVFMFFFSIFLSIITVYSKDEKEVSITFVDKNLLIKNKKSTFLILSDLINKGNVEYTNIIMANKKNNLLNKKLMIDDIKYKEEKSNIKIYYKDYSFCIYRSVVNEIINCNFVYLYDKTNINGIELDEKIDVIFLEGDIPIKLEEEIYSKWIDIYTLKTEEKIILKLYDNNYQILATSN